MRVSLVKDAGRESVGGGALPGLEVDRGQHFIVSCAVQHHGQQVLVRGQSLSRTFHLQHVIVALEGPPFQSWRERDTHTILD